MLRWSSSAENGGCGGKQTPNLAPKGDPLVDIMAMDKPCEICGDVGYPELLIICSKCNVSCEHTYCMKICQRDATETWICEECDLPNKVDSLKPVPCKLLEDPVTRAKIKIPPQNTKVKYISPEEVIGLGSGASTKDSSTRHASNPAKYLASPHKRVSMGSPHLGGSIAPGHKSVLPGSMKRNPVFSQGRGEDKSLKRSGTLDNLSATRDRQGQMQAATAGLSLLPSCVMRERKTLLPSKDQHSCKELAADAHSTCTRVKLLSEIVDKEKDAVPLSSYCQAVASPGDGLCKDTHHWNSAHTGRELRDAPLKFDKYLQNHPALHPTWKGSFRIIGVAAAVEFCHGLQAHPASKVHAKVYNFSRKMPEVLEFELLPRLNLWREIFDDDGPDGLDIGLYFFPYAERSKQGYTGLLDHLKKHDVVMRCSMMGSVELLIWTSEHLHEDSQRINGSYFAWGFFREPISKEATLKERTDLDNSELVDMEIDMIGGEDLQKDHNVCASEGKEIMVRQEKPSLEASTVIDMDLDMLEGQSDCLQESKDSLQIASTLKNEFAFQHVLQNSCSKVFTIR